MPKVRNISPLGDLFVPSLGVTVPSGAVLALDDDQQEVADNLLAQSGTWVQVVPRTTTPEPAPEAVAEAPAEEPVAEDTEPAAEPDSTEQPVADEQPTTDDGTAPAEPTA